MKKEREGKLDGTIGPLSSAVFSVPYDMGQCLSSLLFCFVSFFLSPPLFLPAGYPDG